MLILTAVLTTGALTLTACGSRDDSKSSGGDGGNQTVVIGLDAPLTGDLSALGLGIKNSAELAVKTANKDKTVPGITFKLEALDDQAQPSVGQQNAVKLIGTKEVLGVVGPLNSGVAQSMQKPLNDAKLTQVSPANTGTELTQGNDWKTGNKKRPFASYFRTATTDQIQGAFAAKYLFETAKIKDVYLIDDQKPYGAGLAASFKAKFTELGGKIVGTDHVNPEDRDFNSVATKVKSSKAKAVYYGGEYPAGAPLSQQIKDSVKIPFMGGDGMYSADFISLNKKAEGDIATSVGKPVEELESAKKFIADYKTAGYKDAYEAYGGGTYDATWSIIEAVKIVAAENDGKIPAEDGRAKVLAAMDKVKFEGVTGPVSFDEFGDTTNTLMTAYQVTGGKWVSKVSGTVE
ncbi:branched-chain amino acid ABC transporter substrate-binding protein [Streptomyces fimicarius]|uniref:Branched-chain amino acid ABC transporter substrate-binding protein n=1 Tax=Streptomyces caviscabies TaxID=90079 RepID=A0ABW2M9N1_9ACTN|nr:MULTISPECIES: branched-chain amino acid ABC transporter substrate-binding protein [Streptomyces]MCL6286450.1 branched-chain amino acid ABC transporter substrate-binding protein [Streptomyces sp. 43Y-GA-1]MCX4708095.1 branched-chain amino acid ABC transporter substrate-binding protein [Streptomyces griseus]MDX2668725.1 branched-chain amino acid ABC transporter substrate-binding protein [Streptomyces sp. NRRL_ISP-5395]MDX3501580.1 branched-chain amino acid ABC transporter substrate-binding pro